MGERSFKIFLTPGELAAEMNSQWIPIEEIPFLAQVRYYKRTYWNFWHPIIVEIAGRKWAVEYRAVYRDGIPDPQNALIIFTSTDKDETKFESGDDLSSRSAAICPIRLFQCSPMNSEGIFVPTRKKLYQFATFSTGWGDGGNETLYLSLDEGGFPESIYLEFFCL